jgi:aminoglycoside phosphotransferase (APT) family kinase protein
MNRSAGDATVLLDQAKRIVADQFGPGAVLSELRRNRFPYIGSYDCYAVEVCTKDGDELQIFQKDFAFTRQSKDDPQRRRERELRVYRDLLAKADLGTAAYYGSVWDESEGRFWLLLELVRGTLIEKADSETGVLAAEWLARLHGHFQREPEELASCEFLTRYDSAFFRTKATHALRDAYSFCETSARKLETVLQDFEPLAEAMAAPPCTLVHGGYIPWHILLDTEREPGRVCAIDWELAGIGSTLYDLAFFTADAEPDVRDTICDAYRMEAMRRGVPVLDSATLRTVVDCFRFHRMIDWLSRSNERGFKIGKVSRLVDEAQRLRRQIPI